MEESSLAPDKKPVEVKPPRFFNSFTEVAVNE